MVSVDVDKDGRCWRMGNADDVAWIVGHTLDGLTVTAAIPPGFEAYAPFYPGEGADITLHEHPIVDILKAHTTRSRGGSAIWIRGAMTSSSTPPLGDALLGLELRPGGSRPGASTDVADRSYARGTLRCPA